MKTLNLFALIFAAFTSTYAAAETNLCYFGGSPNGAVRHPFQRIDSPGRIPRAYATRLSSDVTATVSLIQGHSARYVLLVTYKNSEVTLRDEYVDFAPARFLTVTGSVKGQQLYCQFDPNSF